MAKSSMRSGPRPDDHVIVLFGATGDLARRSLLPGLFHLAAAGLMPERYRIVGSAPASAALSDEEFRERARQAVEQFGGTKPEGQAWETFAASLSFGAADPDHTEPLAQAITAAEQAIGGHPGRLFHLAVPPAAFGSVVNEIAGMGLAGGSRIIVEKPFGYDLASARELDARLHATFDESQVFRIDHFLGKESVDNILAFRFANGMFEPIWNRQHIRYVQVDVPETLSIEGRAAFYDPTGAYRDMIVTHLFQVLGFVAMEPPSAMDARSLRVEKAKVFDALRPLDPRHVVRGQYEGYRNEPGVPPESQTETLAAVRVEIDNWRWAGVPFFLRSGKRMGGSQQVITLGFHQPPLKIFRIDPADAPRDAYDELVIDFADPGSITARFLAKIPGPEIELGAASMVFRYEESFAGAHALDGYERLILLAMLGDQSLFTSTEQIERLWEVSEPLLQNPPPVQPYPQGSWGPQPAIDHLVRPFRWYLPDG
jgi:glucose-6-phosphate 1-dehydrogenase